MHLPFADETFDAVTSNFVYHNISVKDRRELLMESLRVLKKGGVFAFHDVYSPLTFGNMDLFVQTLRNMGYHEVCLISSVDCGLITRLEARRLLLKHAGLLYGVK